MFSVRTKMKLVWSEERFRQAPLSTWPGLQAVWTVDQTVEIKLRF